MRFIYGVIIFKHVENMIYEYLVKSKKDDQIEEIRSICLERYSNDSDEFLIRWLEQNHYLSEIFSEINNYYSNGDIHYIGETLFDEDYNDDIETIEKDGEELVILCKVTKEDKQKVVNDINKLSSIIPSIKEHINQPKYQFL